ncbi:hypothetical protein [Acinetobacter sp. ANC 5414]|uniref:hypothetical protein n=1 Tax=Acinetobacter sp. ANC 5414 TaxID=2731251 RepID=UPI00148F4727|nr:hypothetical protein [Acinetobacter sp. ANC 5414]NNH01399.1 hypothetical protein [Acinetobacter sp. ANC 5414]
MINKDAGDVELNTNPISQEKVSQVFNIKILGNVGNLSSGNNHSDIQQQSNNSLIPIEFLEIIKSLKGADIQDEIALEIEKKIEMLGVSIGTAEYKKLYGELMSFVSNHVTVFGFIAPFIPMLTSYLS